MDTMGCKRVVRSQGWGSGKKVMEETHRESLGVEGLMKGLRRHWWLIALCVVVVTGTAAGLSLVQQKTYSATAKLLFADPQFDQKLFGQSYTISNRDPQGD